MESLEAKVVKSLDGESDKLFTFIPYLLQDLWEMGSAPEQIIGLVQRYIENSRSIRVLDLGCGKGAVSVILAKAVGCKVKGIDGMASFIADAKQKANEFGVSSLCQFEVGDIRECTETGYDLVIYGACGDALGDFEMVVTRLASMVKAGGYIIIDDAFNDGEDEISGYLGHERILRIFVENGLELLLEEVAGEDELADINDDNNKKIAQRVAELKKKYSAKAEIFDNYLKNQLRESELLESDLKCVVWLLKKAI